MTARPYVNPKLKDYVAGLLESEAQLAEDLKNESQRSAILLVLCTLLFMLVVVLLAVLFL